MSTENKVAVAEQTQTSTHVEPLTTKQLSVLTVGIKNELNNINSAVENIKSRSLKVASMFAKVNAHKNELPDLGYENIEEYALREFNMQYSTMRAYVSIGESGLIDEKGKCLIGDFSFDQLRAINSLHDEKAIKALIDNNMLTSDMTSKDVKSVIKKAKEAKKIMEDEDNIIDVINTPVSESKDAPSRAEKIAELNKKVGKLFDEYADYLSEPLTKESAVIIVDDAEAESELAHNIRMLEMCLTEVVEHISSTVLGGLN